MNTLQDGSKDSKLVEVWDPLVRVFHWALVVGFFAAYLTGDEWDLAHEIIGYFVAALIVIRLLWGLFGSKHARFKDFLYSPSVIVTFLRDSMRFRAKRYLGHNPAGGVMVLALLAAISALSVTGTLLTLENYRQLEWLEELHEGLANGTLVLIALHVLGVILASFEHQENLVKSMFTGRKRNE